MYDHLKGGNTMETEESGLEVLDEGVEGTELVSGCCTGGLSSARK